MLGKSFGNYEITAHLGKGGMGDVYRARDARLDRDVAIKTLPPEFTADADRLARFEREAKVLASLNHPNIAAIFGLEEAEGRQCLVLELVAGENLAERLARTGPMPLDEALPVALQIAEGLEAAHESGVVHRDLKPGNVMVDGEGRVKLLDFGLAKAAEVAATGSTPDLSASPTLTGQMTQAGVILGTAQYMSPEQARGKAVDKRADIWAFGCVLFEMLAGRPAFAGSDVAEILSAVIQLEPDLERLPPETPRAVRRLIERCLRKDPRGRLRDVGDARTELEEAIRAPRDDGAPAEAVPSRQPRSAVLPWAIVAVLAAALAGVVAWRSGDGGGEVPLRRFSIDVPWQAAPNWTDFIVAISPSGSHVAYNCRDGNQVFLCVRALDSLTPKPVADARDMELLGFSPDGAWVAFHDGNALAKVSIQGGQTQTVFRLEGAPFKEVGGFSWGDDDTILMETDAGLYRVAAAGGEPEPVVPIEDGGPVTWLGSPVHLPGGGRALVTVWHGDDEANAGVVDLADGTLREFPLRGSGFVYSPTGHVVFLQDDTLVAATFDPDAAGPVGEPVPVLEGVRDRPGLAADGTLVYIPTRGESSARLVWVDRDGRPTPVAGERRNYSHLDLDPGGHRALLNIYPGTYVLDLDRGTRNLLADGGFPIWSSDGRRATFNGRDGLVQQPADGSGAPETLVEADGWLVPTSWNPATGDLAYYSHRTYDIRILPPEGEPFVFLGGPGKKRSGRFSPNGAWLAYVNDTTGEYQVYVTAYPGHGPNVAVSVDGGMSPIWSPDGRELFFRDGGKVMAAEVRYEDGIRFGTPVELFDGPYTLDLMGHQRYDVSPDGRSFLMVENSDDFPIVVVQGWGGELERLLPTAR
jgi:hypothetical protein